MLENIVLVTDTAANLGGISDVVINTVTMLAARGYKLYLFIGTGEPDKRLQGIRNLTIISLDQYSPLKDPCKIRAMINGIYNIKAKRRLRALLRTLDRDKTVIHIHSWINMPSSSVFTAAFKEGFRVFVTLHEYSLVCPNGNCYNFVANHICEIPPMSLKCLLTSCDKRHYYHKLWRNIRNFVQNRVIRKGRIGYIFISEFSKKQILRRIPAPQNQFLVKNPISFKDRFRIEAENNTIFLFIGRLSPEKGAANFCSAVRDTGVEGVIIGDGELRAGLEAQYPEITFTGWLGKEEILEWLKKTRCLIFPSVWYEVSPLVPLEVNAYGIPVIASGCSAASDNASFVYDTVEELKNFIKYVSSHDISQLSKDVYNNFDETPTLNYAENLLKVYNTPLI